MRYSIGPSRDYRQKCTGHLHLRNFEHLLRLRGNTSSTFDTGGAASHDPVVSEIAHSDHSRQQVSPIHKDGPHGATPAPAPMCTAA